jgi:hypothetical protein
VPERLGRSTRRDGRATALPPSHGAAARAGTSDATSSPALRSACPPESRRGEAVRGRGRAKSHTPGLAGRGDIRPYVQSARLREEPRSANAERHRVVRARARGPKRATSDNGAPLSGGVPHPTLRGAERKVAVPGARPAPAAVRGHRRRARRVTGATSSGRPAPRAGRQPRASSQRGPAFKKGRWAAWRAPSRRRAPRRPAHRWSVASAHGRGRARALPLVRARHAALVKGRGRARQSHGARRRAWRPACPRSCPPSTPGDRPVRRAARSRAVGFGTRAVGFDR